MKNFALAVLLSAVLVVVGFCLSPNLGLIAFTFIPLLLLLTHNGLRVLLSTLVLALFGLVAAQGVPAIGDPPPAVPDQQTLNTLANVALLTLSGWLVIPVTAAIARLGLKAKVDVSAKFIAGCLSILAVGVQGYAAGVYGSGTHGLLNAFLASLVAFVNWYGVNYAQIYNAQRGALKAVLPKADAQGDVSTIGGATSSANPAPLDYVTDVMQREGQP